MNQTRANPLDLIKRAQQEALQDIGDETSQEKRLAIHYGKLTIQLAELCAAYNMQAYAFEKAVEPPVKGEAFHVLMDETPVTLDVSTDYTDESPTPVIDACFVGKHDVWMSLAESTQAKLYAALDEAIDKARADAAYERGAERVADRADEAVAA